MIQKRNSQVKPAIDGAHKKQNIVCLIENWFAQMMGFWFLSIRFTQFQLFGVVKTSSPRGQVKLFSLVF